ncbi:hypothetical protein [Mediterraneibacter gnavus]|uniref:hypothetical protein n=1 Tax=Mediterraneibacter gnavus TaxID=33038 RepID=UPI001FAC71EA|nr:hypothetical protein [Mediterraneibacter gnavus]MDB8719881.1 hypothetical protein [Mediterraneibacter gnavus]
MNKDTLNIYHAPTEKNYLCLCLNTDIFTADCRKYMLDCFLNYSVNPNLRFHSRIDKIIDDVIREKINIPHKFRMRLESRHCIESRVIYFRFRVLDKSCLQCNVFLKGLSDEMKEALSDERIDFAVLYEGIQGSQQDIDTDDKDGFCGSQPQVPFLADGACPVR